MHMSCHTGTVSDQCTVCVEVLHIHVHMCTRSGTSMEYRVPINTHSSAASWTPYTAVIQNKY